MESETITLKLKNEIIDESFQHGMLGSSALLFTIDKHQFSYCVLDLTRNKIVVLKDYQFQPGGNNAGFLATVLQEDELLSNLKPTKVIAAVHSENIVLIPEPLFSKDHAREALELTNAPIKNEVVKHDLIKICDVHLVYSIPTDLLVEITSHYFDIIILNARTAFIENQLMLNKHIQEEIISINVRKHLFDIIITKGNELLFANTFGFFSGEDFIYYILFVMEQLELSPDITTVVLYGEIDKTNSAWIALNKYIRNCKLGERQDNLEFAYGFERIQPHQYHLLFSQQLCVS
jgi:hypothetical protein